MQPTSEGTKQCKPRSRKRSDDMEQIIVVIVAAAKAGAVMIWVVTTLYLNCRTIEGMKSDMANRGIEPQMYPTI